MKKAFILLTLGLSLFFIGCDGSDPEPVDNRPDCEKNNTAILQVSNSFDNPYDLYIDKKHLGVINGGAALSNIKVPSDRVFEIKAIQKSGYVIYPTIVEGETNVKSCSNSSFVIR